jgi:hypothetical protein
MKNLAGWFALKREKVISEYISKITSKLTPKYEWIGCTQQKFTESY